ncbi:MAG TPA: hypothetical protein VFR09_02325 [Alphaproteobacteria bacterium]|nr:hypothetical protein [Alphaproteobacteria bacterium]
MTNAVGITSTPTGAAPTANPPVSTSAQTQSSQPVGKTAAAYSISPRIVDDPTAGLLVQYLNSSGQVESQIPSTRVVAYLRAGLTAEGYAKPEAGAAASATA